VDFVLEPEPPGEPPTGSLSGRVFLPNSQTPAVGIQVIPFTKDAPFPEANTTASTGGATYRLGTALGVETDENGAFLLEGLRPGRYGVYVTPYADLTSFRREALRPEFANLLPALSELVEVKENEETKDVQVVLKAGGSLAVTVRDAETNEPVASAWVGLHGWVAEEIPFHHLSHPGNTDKQGRCRIDGLLSGTYSVTVTAPNYRMQQPKALVLAGQEQTLEVRLERGGG
jgi:hypothetical protein